MENGGPFVTPTIHQHYQQLQRQVLEISKTLAWSWWIVKIPWRKPLQHLSGRRQHQLPRMQGPQLAKIMRNFSVSPVVNFCQLPFQIPTPTFSALICTIKNSRYTHYWHRQCTMQSSKPCRDVHGHMCCQSLLLTFHIPKSTALIHSIINPGWGYPWVMRTYFQSFMPCRGMHNRLQCLLPHLLRNDAWTLTIRLWLTLVSSN